jgi:hypothetical protein
MHPYQRIPVTGFWSRAVATNFDPSALVRTSVPLVRRHDRVASAGSCFAAHLIPFLEASGLTYLRTEFRHTAFQPIASEHLGYASFSAAYGHVYTVRQLLQLFRRSMGEFAPVEDRWVTPDGVIDPFRPGLRYHALTEREFDLLTRSHLRAVRSMFEQTNVFIFTLGLTEAWVSRVDGAVFPACPGTVAGVFDEARHAFVNFTVSEMTADLSEFVEALRRVNPSVRLILTVSPVALVATATNTHVLCANTYSKAALRVVAEEATHRHHRVTYFPAFEIVTGPQAPSTFLGADRRSVSDLAVQTVMSAFLAHCQRPGANPVESTVRSAAERARDSDAHRTSGRSLSAVLADAECEEAMQDRARELTS